MRFSSSGRLSAPRSTASRSTSTASSVNSSAMPSSRARMSSTSAIWLNALGDELDRVADGEPRGREMQCAPGVRGGDDGRTRARDRVDLAGSDGGRLLGVERGVGTAGSTAQTVVVELDERGDIRTKDGSHVMVRALHMSKMARILDGDDRTTGRGPSRWRETV